MIYLMTHGSGVQGSGSGFRVYGLRFRAQGSGHFLRVELHVRVSGSSDPLRFSSVFTLPL